MKLYERSLDRLRGERLLHDLTTTVSLLKTSDKDVLGSRSVCVCNSPGQAAAFMTAAGTFWYAVTPKLQAYTLTSTPN